MLFDDLKTFVAVIDHNSLKGAANALSLTQSAISRRIQHLEESLGANLFDRSSKPPKATALAHRIYAMAVPLLLDVDRLRDVPRENTAPSGIFNLGLTDVVADVVLFDTVMEMKSVFPALDVRLHTDWSFKLRQQLEQGGLNAAVLMLTSPSALPNGMAGRFITTLEVVVVQSRRKPLVKSKAEIAALADQNWILNPEGCGYRAALQRHMEGVGGELKLSVAMHNTELQLKLIAEGLGLGLVPRSVLKHSSYNSDLAIVEAIDFSLTIDVWLVHPQQMGNLKLAAELLGATMLTTFSAYT